MAFTPAESLLRHLGIAEPNDIDLKAIAFHVGARVRYYPLSGCEARIVGIGDAAIITVNASSSPRRQRFSIAHELGHWHHHRGKSLACRAEEHTSQNVSPLERVADGYAADLLMPNYLFRPVAQQQEKLTLKAVKAVADIFDTSVTATAIRLIESGLFPALLVCHGIHGKKWFTRAPSVPDHWFPIATLDANSSALNVLFGRRGDDPAPRKIGASAWFNCREAPYHDVHEQSMRTSDTEVLTLILFNDPRALQESTNHFR